MRTHSLTHSLTHSPSVDRPRKHRYMHHLVGNIASDRCVLCVEIAHGFEELTLLDASGGRTSTVRGNEGNQSRRGHKQYKRSRWTEEMEIIEPKTTSVNMMSMDMQNLFKDDSQIYYVLRRGASNRKSDQKRIVTNWSRIQED